MKFRTAAGYRTTISALPGVLTTCLALSITSLALAANAPVWTQHNDNLRTGENLKETILKPQVVNSTTFGKLFTYSLDDQTYSQPLYMPRLKMAVDHAVHNVVFVASVNNTVYAFDADSNTANSGSPLWVDHLTPTGARPVNRQDERNVGACGGGYSDFAGNMGIVGTPVINTRTNTIYLVARTVENGNFIQRLHALDVASGKEKFNSPTIIQATADGGASTFDPLIQNQRPALFLLDVGTPSQPNYIVYIAWSSHCDNGNYKGWIMGYQASDVSKQVVAWDDEPSGSEGGIWQAGQAPVSDSDGNIYFMTGNGTWNGTTDLGESFVKLTPSSTGTLTVADYFTPSDYQQLNNADADLGASGVIGIPGTALIAGGGKSGTLYLVDTGNMGQEHAKDAMLQQFQAVYPTGGQAGKIEAPPAYFSTTSGQYLYVWGTNDVLRAYQFTAGSNQDSGSFNTSAAATGVVTAPALNSGDPGGFLSVSANGKANGIIWAYAPYGGDANQSVVTGILYAYDATKFVTVDGKKQLTLLWSSHQNQARDDSGNFAKFTAPTIANGKVFVSSWAAGASGAGQLCVYGLLP